ncbi:Photosynthetic reaction center cytochrome c subunit [Sphingomonas sp. EC-HK361]|uniref:photosynthetic reaction center cytochrome PufC n=1 Tax=Sphingomonas sp. EC-HK361 TaxID=2038397 RepID=UPI0012541902|nr:photosynthetic reaction center cytochrome PufC [Sphingomonas sp. EC-HK361]VVS99807.1 Photosynthetic reaction center cytochrome c subunit [Sphingomonas sp. EC-HK361]
MIRYQIAAALTVAVSLSACEPGAKSSVQTGPRGTGMDQIVDISAMKKASAVPAPPYPLPADGGQTAGAAYQNVKVLGGISKDRFDHLMASITQWVAPPEQGCNYCHNPENLASDEKYTKVVARKMLQMTRNINTRWSSHVQNVGVTCYTCHRGNAVPEYKWAIAGGTPNPNSILGNKRGQNAPDPNVAYASLPHDPFDAFLSSNGPDNIRVAGKSAFPNGKGASIKDAEASYGLMMHLSGALGVNCTFCHNTQSLGSWALSRQQRATAYYGIRMVRDINADYISTLQTVFPAYRKGPHGDPYKVNCMTCHQGQSKPLGGVSMLAQAPGLKGPPMATAQDVGGAAGAAATRATFDNPQAVNSGQTPVARPTPAAPPTGQ